MSVIYNSFNQYYFLNVNLQGNNFYDTFLRNARLAWGISKCIDISMFESCVSVFVEPYLASIQVRLWCAYNCIFRICTFVIYSKIYSDSCLLYLNFEIQVTMTILSYYILECLYHKDAYSKSDSHLL